MKRKLAILLAALLLLFTLAGCAENANSTTGNESTNDTTENTDTANNDESGDGSIDDANGSSSDVLEVVLASGGRTLDPAAATDSISAMFVNAAYDQLVTYGTITQNGLTIADPDNIQPSLAKSWDVSEDGMEYIFYLDETATFANGDPVNANAVIYSLNRVANSATSSFFFALTNIDEMEEIDEYTVKFTLTQPCTILFKLLQMHILSIVNPLELADIDDIDTYMTNNTAGSGAYTIDKWEASTEAILTARNDYWKGQVPNSGVHVQFVAEASNRLLLAEKGEVDIALSILAKDTDLLSENETVDVNIYESNAVTYMAMNTQAEPFNNPLVRQAINCAIPKESIVDSVLYGVGAALDYVIPSAMPGYLENPETAFSLDLEKAQDLLEEAGYGDGFEFTLTVNSSRQDEVDAAVLIQAELAKINVKVSIDQAEASQYSEIIRSDNVEAAICTYTAFVNDPGYFFGNTLHSQGEYNYAKYSNSQVDEYWDEAEKTNDAELRLENYTKAQAAVFEDSPWAVLYEGRTIVVLNESVEDYIHFPDGALRFNTISK